MTSTEWPLSRSHSLWHDLREGTLGIVRAISANEGPLQVVRLENTTDAGLEFEAAREAERVVAGRAQWVEVCPRSWLAQTKDIHSLECRHDVHESQFPRRSIFRQSNKLVRVPISYAITGTFKDKHLLHKTREVSYSISTVGSKLLLAARVSYRLHAYLLPTVTPARISPEMQRQTV